MATDINSNHNQPLPVDFSATVQEQLQRKTKHGIMDLKAVLFSSVKRRKGHFLITHMDLASVFQICERHVI